MEFNEKLQQLRKQKGITQEQLAQALYVSRTAISKWESGRGYPNIDSLKEIASFFEITIDELLSSDEILNIAQQDGKQREKRFRDLIFALLDISSAMLLFVPFFGEKANGIAQGVSLLSLSETAAYIKITYLVFVVAIIVFGILSLALQNCDKRFWVQNKSAASLFLNAVGAILFVISLQPYAATFLLTILAIKVLILIKKR